MIMICGIMLEVGNKGLWVMSLSLSFSMQRFNVWAEEACIGECC